MQEGLFFSVIIPTYNRAEFIQKTIESVQSQTYPDFEIIVVDDGSTDDTPQVMEMIAHPRLFYYQKENGERAAARNYGIQRAQGNYITFLDSDDIFYPDYLANAAESIEKYEYPPFFHLAYEVADPALNPLTQINKLRSDNIKMFIKGNPLSCMGVFLKQEITADFLFNEDRNLSASEDWELWIRVAANYGIKTDNRVSAALINHATRSVLNDTEENLAKRKELALRYAFQDKKVQELFQGYYPKIEAYWDSYIALHLVLSQENKAGLRYLWKSLKKHPLSIFERRFLAIIKNLLLSLIRRENTPVHH